MGISVSDFVAGGFVVTVEGQDGSYGVYQVLLGAFEGDYDDDLFF